MRGGSFACGSREALADEQVQRRQEVRGVWCRQGEPLSPEAGELPGSLVAEAFVAKGSGGADEPGESTLPRAPGPAARTGFHPT